MPFINMAINIVFLWYAYYILYTKIIFSYTINFQHIFFYVGVI